MGIFLSFLNPRQKGIVTTLDPVFWSMRSWLSNHHELGEWWKKTILWWKSSFFSVPLPSCYVIKCFGSSQWILNTKIFWKANSNFRCNFLLHITNLKTLIPFWCFFERFLTGNSKWCIYWSKTCFKIIWWILSHILWDVYGPKGHCLAHNTQYTQK